MMEQKTSLSSGAMLNAYPDSIGGTLQKIIGLLQRPEMMHSGISTSCPAYLIQIWIAASR